MARRSIYEIRRSLAQQGEVVSPPTSRLWAEIERERLAKMGKSHLAPLPEELLNKRPVEVQVDDLIEREKQLRIKRAMAAMFPNWRNGIEP